MPKYLWRCWNLIKPHTLQQLWQSHRRVFLLADDCAPEDYLQDTVILEKKGGKSLMTNQNFPAARPLHLPKRPLD